MQHDTRYCEEEPLIDFDEGDESPNLQSDIILDVLDIADAEKSDLFECMNTLKRHSVLDVEVVQACQKMYEGKYQDMVCLYIENSHERLNELAEALGREDMPSMIRPSHTLKVTSAQMGASKLFFMAKEMEAFAKAACKSSSSSNDFQHVRGMVEEIKGMLAETEITFTQFLSLNIDYREAEA